MNHSFQPGEKITYEISYNWGFIWVDAGEVYFKTDSLMQDGKCIYFFEAYGTTYHYYDWIFKVRDLYQSKLDPENFRPIWFQKKINEGGNEIFNQYDFDAFSNQINIQVKNSGKPLQSKIVTYDDLYYDVLSATYLVRNINYDLYQTGDTIPVKFLIDDKLYKTYIRYLGKESVKTRTGRTYRCIKLSALLVEGTIFKGGEDLVVWITDDQNKIPVMAEAKILIGSVKAYLTGYEGLKFKPEATEADTR